MKSLTLALALAGALPEAPPPPPAALESAPAARKAWDGVQLTIDTMSPAFTSIHDPRLDIRLTGHAFADSMSFSGTIQAQASPLFPGQPKQGVRLSGSGVQLELRSFGDGWWLSGRVEDGRSSAVSGQLTAAGGGSYRLLADGANLSVTKTGWGWTFDGSADLDRFGKKKLAAVAAAFAAAVRTR